MLKSVLDAALVTKVSSLGGISSATSTSACSSTASSAARDENGRFIRVTVIELTDLGLGFLTGGAETESGSILTGAGTYSVRTICADDD